MAGRWRVLIEGVEDLSNPRYRIGDAFRHAKLAVTGDDDALKDIFVELGSGAEVQKTNVFGVPSSGTAKCGYVFFLKSPPPGQALVFRVLKAHKIQKDALFGEAFVNGPVGRQKLALTRHDKPRGFLLVEVRDALQEPPNSGGASNRSAASNASGRAPPPTLPSAAVQRPASGSDGGQGRCGGAGAMVASCMSCGAGLLALVGMRDRQAAFLKAKASDPAVVKLPSGLMYKVVKRGHGQVHPAMHNQVECHYKGMFVNGKVFDSSEDRGPQTFGVGQVVKGWTEALLKMVEGDKWELYLPPHLAYGEAGAGPIPKNTVLWFHIELLRIRGGAVRR
mmetsp:Transcript_16513/g.57822  ORF Transcript_16513/g.57822 Transcript_16513/m.57822 type:complete len:335 (-) Transcript_16513:63-1067(-)